MRNLISQWDTERLERDFVGIRCSLASPQVIRSWSFGEVKSPETVNYRTFQPEYDGLFCAKIFGPTRDFECQCGKYKRVKHRGVVCEKCGVEVTTARIRRERMGHIELAAPVSHIWFLKSMPSRLAMVLDMMQRDIERVLYFEAHVVINPGDSDKERGDVLLEDEYQKVRQQDPTVVMKMGGEAIQQLLRELELEEEIKILEREVKEITAVARRRKCARRLKLLRSMHKAHLRPEWMVLTVLPVLPPDLRPLVPIDGGRFTSSDLNDLYRRILNRNNRLRRLLELNAPDIIVRNEKRMLQEAVDALLDNGRRGSAVTGSNRRPLKSLSDMVRGKGGRFRQNLLGKRIDYSGRSVIVVGPTLRLHQCGIPKLMALELFKPFVYGELERREHALTIRAARKLVERQTPEVWDALGHIIRQHPVMLNRAPTLHRLGVQAFEPILVEGKAIQLHPLVCTAFNADFDGDQMAVHIPLSLEAQIEARVLMMSTNNILSPANGQPIIVPSKDIVLGLYYLTREKVGAKGEWHTFADMDEALLGFDHGVVELQSRIKVRMNEELVDTTPGRLILYRVLPSNLPFSLVNKVMKSSQIAQVVHDAFIHSGIKDTVVLADQMMYLGFDYATKSGLSLAIEDLKVPELKKEIIDKAMGEVQNIDKDRQAGLVTAGETYNKIIDIWSNATEKVESSLQENLRAETRVNSKGEEEQQDSFNPLFMYADSGARGSPAQMRQLAGMRGLMSRPDGSIIETPIKASFREGLSVLEYFMSTHGARKGLADTALKTANSGYLTRRLVDVSHSLIVTIDDCGTDEGLEMTAVIEGGKVIQPLSERVYGRVLATDVLDESDEIVLEKGVLVDHNNIDLLGKSSAFSIKVRSVITCNAKSGVCAKCYGRDLARGHLVSKGEAVGVVAAQSIGEPGTQLTMRTFHIGGAASRTTEQDRVVVNSDGVIHYEMPTIKKKDGTYVALSRSGVLSLRDAKGSERERYRIPYGAVLHVPSLSEVKGGATIATWNPHARPIFSDVAGKIKFQEIEHNLTATFTEDVLTGAVSIQVLDTVARPNSAANLKPGIMVTDKAGEPVTANKGAYFLPDNATVSVNDGAQIEAGEIIARVPLEGSKTRDITGGLPRVIELFEARKPKDPAILAEVSGRIGFGNETKLKNRLFIYPTEKDIENGESPEPYETLIQKTRRLSVTEGDEVTRGDVIADGPIDPHDLLRLKGLNEFTASMCQEIQEIYRMQGVTINEKHIEIIINQMLRNVEITDEGDTYLVIGDVLSSDKVNILNAEVSARGGKEATFRRVLLGITRAAVGTDSFISAASFQETTKVLTEAAISGKVDKLKALKENVIVGRLIPAGTGFKHRSDIIEGDDQFSLESVRKTFSKELESANIKGEEGGEDGQESSASEAADEGDEPAVSESDGKS